MLTADRNGVRFILAFSDERAPARYARERGALAREWTYQTVLGAPLISSPSSPTSSGPRAHSSRN